MGRSVCTPEEAEELEKSFEINCEKAAQAILSADFFLLATGAGFSKDSGLAVYKDIADIPAYHKIEKNYVQLCQPHWMKTDPEIFFGFWGGCFNDYRKTTPHLGYSIIKEWRDRFFSQTSKISTEFSDLKRGEEEETPGPFFIYTSNVDSHSLKAGFRSCEMTQIHGTVEDWQCSVPCDNFLWKAPKNHQFKVDVETMRAPNVEVEAEEDHWKSNHPKCPKCNSLARPAILMFGDFDWISPERHSLSHGWEALVSRMVRTENKKLCILEVGCGDNVATVRNHSESLLNQAGGVTLIRVNLDLPKSDGSKNSKFVISLKSTGLRAIQEINKHLQKQTIEPLESKPNVLENLEEKLSDLKL